MLYGLMIFLLKMNKNETNVQKSNSLYQNLSYLENPKFINPNFYL